MSRSFRKEACVENFQQALRAQEQGADQVELCSHLALDGLTPNFKDIELCLEQLDILVKVMIRPRAGSFIISNEVREIMISEILAVKEIGVSDIVLGCTTQEGSLDYETIAQLIQTALPMHVTIHKAIDTCLDPVREVTQINQLEGITNILTSGGRATAKSGAIVIKKMMEAARDDLVIIPAGRITKRNIRWLHPILQASVYHGKLIVGTLE